MFIPFLSLDPNIWNFLKAFEESLSLSEIATKTGMQPYALSRILSKIKGGSIGLGLAFEARLESAGLLRIAVISRKTLETLPYLQSARVLRVLGRRLHLYTGLLPSDEETIEDWLSNFEEGAFVVRGFERQWWRTNSPATVYSEGCVGGDIGAVKVQNRSPPSLSSKEVELDEVDVLLLWAKFKWPFTSLREAERESERLSLIHI